MDERVERSRGGKGEYMHNLVAAPRAARGRILSVIGIAMIAGGSLVAVACTGADGAAGAPGAAGAAGSQGTPGPIGPAGANGSSGVLDAGVATSCMSPCHGFNGVIAQFQTSVHYSAYVANAGTATADEWTAPGAACGNCHASDALAKRDSLGIVGDGGVANASHGELEYFNSSTGKVTDSTYTGSTVLAEVYCTTCHAVTPTNDPHLTNVPWTPGSFPLVVASGPTDPAFIEKSPVLGLTTGSSIGMLGTANTCVSCHKSRKDVTSYITASNVLTSTHWGPHEGPQADIFSAAGGYQFAGLTYGTSTHQLKLTCVDCHMPEVTTNHGVPDHSFAPRLSACQSCHAGETSFDINAGQTRIRNAMFQFQLALSNAGYLTRSAASPYAALQSDELTDGNFELDQTRPGGPALTADQAGALYNYILIARGGAMGAHNPKYTAQLIVDSYSKLPGSPPPLTLARPN